MGNRVRRVQPSFAVTEGYVELVGPAFQVTTDEDRLSRYVQTLHDLGDYLDDIEGPQIGDAIDSIVEAANQGRWGRVAELVGPGSLVVEGPMGATVYALGDV